MQTISVLLSRNCFRHAFVTNGECVMKYSGEEVRMVKGDCVIIIANHLVTEIQPTENFHAKVIFIEPGFMEACTPHTSYGIVGDWKFCCRGYYRDYWPHHRGNRGTVRYNENEQRHERIDRPTGWTIRFFNNKENEWTEKRFGRLALAIQRRFPEVLCNSLNTFYLIDEFCHISTLLNEAGQSHQLLFHNAS